MYDYVMRLVQKSGCIRKETIQQTFIVNHRNRLCNRTSLALIYDTAQRFFRCPLHRRVPRVCILLTLESVLATQTSGGSVLYKPS